MTSNNDAYVQKLIERDNKRKQNVKLYFARRNAKNDIYKSFFEKHATIDDKKSLKNAIEKITL